MMTWARKAAPYFLVLGFVFGIAPGAYSQGLIDRLLGREQSYEDCVLANMRGVTSDFAARAVRQACQDKTAPSVSEPRLIDVTQALVNDEGGCWVEQHMLKCNLYHNTPRLVVKRVSFRWGVPGRDRELSCSTTQGAVRGFYAVFLCGAMTSEMEGGTIIRGSFKAFGFYQN
jgi:hypothetical protein